MAAKRNPQARRAAQRWIEIPLDDETWVAAARIDIHQGDIRLLEFRVAPRSHGSQGIGEWDRDLADRMNLGSGISMRMLRSVTMESIVSAASEFLIEQTGAPGPVRKKLFKSKTLSSEMALALVAVQYDTLMKFGVPKPSQVLANEFGVTEAVARDRIRRARLKGFLTPAQPGKAGGTLTAAGRAAAKLLEPPK